MGITLYVYRLDGKVQTNGHVPSNLSFRRLDIVDQLVIKGGRRWAQGDAADGGQGPCLRLSITR